MSSRKRKSTSASTNLRDAMEGAESANHVSPAVGTGTTAGSETSMAQTPAQPAATVLQQTHTLQSLSDQVRQMNAVLQTLAATIEASASAAASTTQTTSASASSTSSLPVILAPQTTSASASSADGVPTSTQTPQATSASASSTSGVSANQTPQAISVSASSTSGVSVNETPQAASVSTSSTSSVSNNIALVSASSNDGNTPPTNSVAVTDEAQRLLATPVDVYHYHYGAVYDAAVHAQHPAGAPHSMMHHYASLKLKPPKLVSGPAGTAGGQTISKDAIVAFLEELRDYRTQGGTTPLCYLLTDAQKHCFVVRANGYYPSENARFTSENISNDVLLTIMKVAVRPQSDFEFKNQVKLISMRDIPKEMEMQLATYQVKFTQLIELYNDVPGAMAVLNVSEAFLAEAFCEGLAPGLRQTIRHKKLKTLAEVEQEANNRVQRAVHGLIALRGVGIEIPGESRASETTSSQAAGNRPANNHRNNKRPFQSGSSRPTHSSQSSNSTSSSATSQGPAEQSQKPAVYCGNCGKRGHTADVCRSKSNHDRAKRAKDDQRASAPRNHPKPSSSSGKQCVRCQRVLVDDIDSYDDCSDTAIAECQGSVAPAHDVTFASGRNITLSLDTCSTHTLISLDLCREMNVQLPKSETLDIQAWDGSIECKTVYCVDVLLKLNNSSNSKPFVFKINCFAVDMVPDMIVCNRDLKTFRIPQFLAATEATFPYAHSWETSPEEDTEEDYGLGVDFPHLHSTPESPDYTIDDTFGDYDRLKALLSKYAQVFMPTNTPMQTEEFFIDLIEGAEVPRQWPRNVPPSIQEEIDKEVERWLTEGICRPSLSSVASPVVAARKPDGSLRLCIDYQRLNKWTVAMSHPLPRVADRLKALQGKKYFAKMDLRWGFHQLAVREDCKHLTAFCTKKGLYEFNRLPFGLKNASGFFQAKVEEVLIGIAGTVLVFIDDLVIAADTEEEFLRILEEVLQRLTDAGVVLKASKCTFGAEAVEYLGYVVDAFGIRLTDKRVQAVREYPVPKNSQAVRRFLGVTNAFRDSIRDYAKLVAPLQRLTKKGITFEWGDDHEQAFTTLRNHIADQATLHHLTYEHPIVLRTDASIEGVGAVLLQIRDGREEPIIFLSQRFSGAATRWSTIEQEAYAIFWAVTKLESYLLGHHFNIETDHRNLLYMTDATAPKVVRWRLRLQEYDFQVIHIPGKINVVADALSRCYRLKAQHSRRSTMAPIQCFRSCHNELCGHHGVQRTKLLLQQAGKLWKTSSEAELDKQIKQFIDNCVTCQKHRSEQGYMNPAIGSTMRYEPFECVAFDTMGPFEEDDDGNKYVVVGIDVFTRTVELSARRDASAKSAASAILEWTGRYGAPREIQSDQGSQFVNETIEELLKFTQSAHRLTLPYRPQANGVVERSNREILKHLRAIVFDRRVKSKWSSVLPLVQRIINSQVHSATGASPMRLLYGDAITINRGFITEWDDQTDIATLDTSEYLTALNQQLSDIVSASQEYQRKVEAKRLSKSPVNPTKFREGQYVLVKYPSGTPDKLTPFWKGPMLVSRVENQTYWCQDLLSGRLTPVFVDRLKAFNQSDLVSNEDIAVADSNMFIVEQFLAHRGNNKKRATLQFKVKWQGYPIAGDDSDWIPWSEAKKNILIDDYLQRHEALRYLLKERTRRRVATV